MIFKILSILAGYLLGSIPIPLMMSRLRRGVDIRKTGSKNMGAANIIREMGVPEGLFVGILDITKGAVAVLIPGLLGLSEIWILSSGFCAILGHKYPVFAGFKGGRGSAVVIGIFLVLSLPAMLVALVIIAAPVFTTRNFAFAISIGLALLPLLIFIFGYPVPLIIYALIIDLFMLLTNLSQVKQDLKSVIKKIHTFDGR